MAASRNGAAERQSGDVPPALSPQQAASGPQGSAAVAWQVDAPTGAVHTGGTANRPITARSHAANRAENRFVVERTGIVPPRKVINSTRYIYNTLLKRGNSFPGKASVIFAQGSAVSGGGGGTRSPGLSDRALRAGRCPARSWAGCRSSSRAGSPRPARAAAARWPWTGCPGTDRRRSGGPSGGRR